MDVPQKMLVKAVTGEPKWEKRLTRLVSLQPSTREASTEEMFWNLGESSEYQNDDQDNQSCTEFRRQLPNLPSNYAENQIKIKMSAISDKIMIRRAGKTMEKEISCCND